MSGAGGGALPLNGPHQHHLLLPCHSHPVVAGAEKGLQRGGAVAGMLLLLLLWLLLLLLWLRLLSSLFLFSLHRF